MSSHSKKRSTALFHTLIFACLISAFSLPSEATGYKRGIWGCGDFEQMQQEYKRNPNVINALGYGTCLLTKGEDNQALLILHNLVNTHSDVLAAYTIAEYIRTDGEMNSKIEAKNLDRAIKSHYTVLYLIDKDSRYPNNGHSIYEMYYQMELYSQYNVTFLHLIKLQAGFIGSYNQALLESQSYTGDKEDLNLYPEHAPYTRDTISKLIKVAHTCAILPKKQHFNVNHYSVIPPVCQSLKDVAILLNPLEHKRPVALQTCSNITKDKKSCPEYYEVVSKMVGLLGKQAKLEKELFIPLNEYEEAMSEAISASH